jgi:two-component system, OmpR family, sensor histidine kinase VanS
MNLSIKRNLFIAISGLILIFVLLSWLLNNFFLDKYYMHSKKITLFESYRHINSIYNGNPEEISLELEKYESTKGLRIVIFDDAMKIKYVFNQRVLDSSGRRNGPRMPFNGMDLKDILAKAKTEQTG